MNVYAFTENVGMGSPNWDLVYDPRMLTSNDICAKNDIKHTANMATISSRINSEKRINHLYEFLFTLDKKIFRNTCMLLHKQECFKGIFLVKIFQSKFRLGEERKFCYSLIQILKEWLVQNFVHDTAFPFVCNLVLYILIYNLKHIWNMNFLKWFKTEDWTYCGLVMPYGNTDLGQHRFR